MAFFTVFQILRMILLKWYARYPQSEGAVFRSGRRSRERAQANRRLRSSPRPPQLRHTAQKVKPERRAERNGRGGKDPPHQMCEPSPPGPVRDRLPRAEGVFVLPANRE